MGLNSFRYKFIVMNSELSPLYLFSDKRDLIALAKLYLILDERKMDRNHILFEKDSMEWNKT